MKPQKRNIQRLRLALLAAMIIAFAAACSPSFNKQKWSEQQANGSYPNRKAMLGNLTGNHLKGMTQEQVIEKLGEPNQKQVNGNNSRYYITREFYDNGKPHHLKNLLVKMRNNRVYEVAVEETEAD